MALTAGVRLGPYEIAGAIGAGGMGEVYRARDTRLDRSVAIKVLPEAFAADPERIARFEHEAKTLAALNHPHIAAIHGLEHSAGVRAIVMEFVEGEDLSDLIARGPLPLDETLSIARQVADALAVAHEHGIVHRDLKPGNIKVRADSSVKVLDFGLAKTVAPGATSSVSMSPTLTSPIGTRIGTIVGTGAYMSPEQARGKPVDKRADIWSFGVVLYEMLTGRRAFEGEDLTLTLAEIMKSEPDWALLPPKTPAPLRLIVQRCLEKDPKRRVRDIGEAWLALERALESPSPEASSAHDRRRNRSLPLTIVPALASVMLATAAAVWILKPAPDADRSTQRFAITLPANQELPLRETPSLALSSDGQRLAYVSARRLYLRTMENEEPRLVLGSDGASSPFFSPDGAYVGFFAQGALKKVAVSGGTAERVCDAPVGLGGSWSTDDTIYFVASNAAPVFSVSARGGSPSAVTTLDRSKGEVSHRWPEVLPGGEAMLLTVWRGPGWDEIDLHLVQLKTGERRVLVKGANGGRYAASGHIVYLHASELTAVPFNLGNLRVTGPPVPLGMEVSMQEGADFTVSDTGLLAYVSGRSELETRVVWVNRDGSSEALSAPSKAYERADISPDGLFAAETVMGPSVGIWIHDLKRNSQSLFTSRTESSQWPVWTPNGARIIYRGTRSGSRNLYWKEANGSGNEEQLTSKGGIQTPTSVSSDGKWLVFSELGTATGMDVWSLPLDGPHTAQLILGTAANEDDASFSPNGPWLAYDSDESGRAEIYLQSFPDSGDKRQVSVGGGIGPKWSADGRELFYFSRDGFMSVSVSPGAKPILGQPQRLFTRRYYRNFFSVSSDGKRFLAIQADDDVERARQVHVVLNWFEELKRRVSPSD